MNNKKTFILTIILLIGQIAISQSKSQIVNLKQDLNYLASDNMKGRLPGSKEDTLAMVYITAELEKVGYKPYFAQNSFPFEFIKSREASSASVIIINGDTLIYGKDYIIPPFSGNGDVFATINTNGKESNADLYEAKSAVILKSTADDIKLKVTSLIDKGASMIFFYNPEDKKFNYSKAELSAQMSVPLIYLSPEAAEIIIKGGALDVYSKIDMQVSRTKSANIVMKLSARKPKGNILIGAHFDHLGMGEYGSRTPNRKEVHNGADDNASGVASVLEIARLYSKNKRGLKYNIIVATFGAEEKGLLGSKKLADSLKKSLDLPLIMFNLDMVGRLVDNKLQVGGIGTFQSADSIVRKVNEKFAFTLSVTKSGTGASDHSSFYTGGVPVLYFTTGVHQQYHTPDDDIELINFDGMAKVTDYIFNLSAEFANGMFIPHFTKVSAGDEEPVMTSFKVSLGVVPDFTYEVGDGFRIGAVTDGKPASKAGLIAGDIITSINGKVVKNIYEYMARLGELKFGDEIDVTVNRDGIILNIMIQL